MAFLRENSTIGTLSRFLNSQRSCFSFRLLQKIIEGAGHDKKWVNWRGSRLCVTCLCRLFGVSRSHLYNIKKAANLGHVNWFHGNSTYLRERSQNKRLLVKNWLDTYLLTTGDYMPDKDIIIIPLNTKKQAYQHFIEYCQNTNSSTASEKYFYRVLNDEFPNLRMHSYCKMGKCEQCVRFRHEAFSYSSEAVLLQVIVLTVSFSSCVWFSSLSGSLIHCTFFCRKEQSKSSISKKFAKNAFCTMAIELKAVFTLRSS